MRQILRDRVEYKKVLPLAKGREYYPFMLVDDVTIRIKAGNGGKGAVAFNKNAMSLGPTGADGGAGGNVIIEGVSDLGSLKQFRNKKEVLAMKGENGKDQFNDGADGKDAIIKVPVGTVVHNLDTQIDFEIIHIGERVLVAKGGMGGKGNFKFRSPRNTSPRRFQPGTPGEGFTLRLELKLIADVGLIGFPNAGKSSLLNALTRASSKVANYPFTTLEPNLGVYHDLILADIPGLIEGASEGKGLGIKFLRHVERTKILFHLVSVESELPGRDYKAVRHELEKYSKTFAEKKEYVFLSKCDLLPEDQLEKKRAELGKATAALQVLSVVDDRGLEQVKKILEQIQREKLAK